MEIGKICLHLHLRHGSMPIHTSVSVPILHTSDCPMRSKDQRTAFHQMEIPFFFFTSILIQSSKDKGEMYFWIVICTQSPVPLIKFHTFLAARDLANKAGIFRPHPPKDLGLSRIFHEDQGSPEASLFPYHKNLKHIFLILSRIPTGIQKLI